MRKCLLLFVMTSSMLFARDVTLQGRVGYFLPTSSILREIYYNGGVIPEVEIAVDAIEHLRVWGNWNLFLRDGQSKGFDTHTSIIISMYSVGLKYDFVLLKGWKFYLGVGPSLNYVVVSDGSIYVTQFFEKTAFGVVGKGGFWFDLPMNLFLDAFVDYSYLYLKPQLYPDVVKYSLDGGGLRTGIGFGVKF